jgi:hypothetical protein
MSTDLDDLRLMGEWHEVKLQDTAVSMLCVPLGIVGIAASKLESVVHSMSCAPSNSVLLLTTNASHAS